MKKINKKTIYIILGIIYTVIFFQEHLFLTWDSSVYFGMSLALGTNLVSGVWHPLRGLSFPLLLRLFEPFGYQNKYLIMCLLYVFFIILLRYLYKIGKDLNIFKNIKEKIIYVVGIVMLVILNPYVFLYYHTILTEFVIMTLSMVLVYLLYKNIFFDFSKNKKKCLINGVLLTLIIVFLYHTKQSFVGLLLLELFLGLLVGCIKHFNYRDILYRVGTLLFCGLVLFGSVKIWDREMTKVGVDGTTEVAERDRANKRLFYGITELKEVGNKDNFNIDIIKKEKDKKEINKVINNESKYKDFTIYEKGNSQYVLYTKGSYSLKEQVPLYIKIVITHPFMVIKSYAYGIYKSVISPEPYHFENTLHSEYYYNNRVTNQLNVAPGYEYAVNDLIDKPVFSFFDFIELHYGKVLFYVYTANMILVPVLFIVSIILFFIVRKKYKKLEDISVVCLLLYGLAFNTIISYVMFAAYIDRYLVPSHIPMFIGDLLLIIMIMRIKRVKRNIAR